MNLIAHPRTFWDLRTLNDRIYREANERVYPDDSDIQLKIVSCASLTASKGVWKKDQETIIHYSVMTLSWAMAWANRMKMFDIPRHLYSHFAACPYCKGKPCVCRQRSGPKPLRTVFAVTTEPPQSVAEFSQQIAEIYPGNTLIESGNHLAAEAVELAIAVSNYRRWGNDPKKEPYLLADIHEEYCDVLAHLAAISHCAGFDLAVETGRIFRGGCCACRKPTCGCEYTAPHH